VILFGIVTLFPSCRDTNRELTIRTDLGDIKVCLYDTTHLHRDNFLKLSKEGYYDNLLFHRVIKNFVIQAGDPNSRNAPRELPLGNGDVGYTLPAEIYPKYFHKKGVLAAARESDDVNPARNSSGGHFYIVIGKVFTESELDSTVMLINERRHKAIFDRLRNKYSTEISQYSAVNNFNALQELAHRISLETRELFEKKKLELSPEQKEAYTTIGGVPSLDGQYTVFGEVTAGMDVVEKISEMSTDENDRPLRDIVIKEIK
jgi:peptidylprolyl isomerase/peptidyl-prolyl cis-trans isomerase B (cyclophilin B)